LNAAYTDAVFGAGGIPQPLALPPQFDAALARELLARCDGLLFTGGADIRPERYGQELHAKTQTMDDRRDAFELEFFRLADERRVPILAVCLGCQVASVCRGGSLIQHVDDLPQSTPVVHHTEDGSDVFHDVRIEPDSRLARITGRTLLEVNSRHHQALDPGRFGGELRPVAFAPDGTVEAVEDCDRRFLLAVQWHPEDLIQREEHMNLFRALVRESADFAARRRAR
jgi:gamma-glutamyl-gamma-aminobutyrate hydrolase PuuD